jgi:hypothetical protein
MRTISLVKRLKWSFTGNMNPHALVIGDVDNDNVNNTKRVSFFTTVNNNNLLSRFVSLLTCRVMSLSLVISTEILPFLKANAHPPFQHTFVVV